jgi:fructuronate reductase
MTSPLSRRAGLGRPAAPVRIAHLGLGSFFRAHQAWYTEHAGDAEHWGYAAFGGRSATLARALRAQDGLYTLVVRAGSTDRFEVVSSVSETYAPDQHEAWLACFRSLDLAAVTITVTEAAYLRGIGGGLDADRPDVRADVETLRRDPTGLVRTAPARLVAGLAARRAAGAGAVALVPCDNLPGNGAVTERVVRDLAELVGGGLASWIEEFVAVVTTVVDRITPRTAPEDLLTVVASTGMDDRCPVVTEPFHEWVLGGEFPAGRPRWEAAGAIFTDDPAPFENRKLWLLNGAHSLLAYAGSIRGHTTVDSAACDEACQAWLEDWWAVASPHLGQPPEQLAAYREALVERFGNKGMHDRLDRIAADGSQKLPIRVLPVLRAERALGRLPAGATRVLAAWICHLRGQGVPVDDAHADEIAPLAQGPIGEAVRRVLGWLDPSIAGDREVTASVLDQCLEFETM